MVERTENQGVTLTTKINEMRNTTTSDQSEIEFLQIAEDAKPIEKILLTSFPRSGNTLIRTYLEKITRVLTGSDCDIKRPLNK